MTFKEAFHKSNNWQRKIVLISLYHNRCLALNSDWNLSDTAKYFEISIALVSENLKLNSHYDEIKDCKSRNEAIIKLRNHNHDPNGKGISNLRNTEKEI